MKVVKTTSQFVMRYAPKTRAPPVAARYLASNTSPVRVKVKHMYANRDPETLWWRVSLQPLQPFKRVVRSWCARRARLAFRQALKARGFDIEGRRLVSETQESDTGKPSSQNLKGSLEFIIRPQCLGEAFSGVRREMDYLLDTLLKYSRAGEGQKPLLRKGGKNMKKIPVNNT